MQSKRRGRGEGTIGRLPDGSWWARISVGYRNGKRARKAIYGETRAEVAAKLTKVLRDLQQGLPIHSDRQTVGQFLTHWLEHVARPRLRPRTYLTYEQATRLHIVPELGRVPLQQLTPQRLQTWLNQHHAGGASARNCQYARAVLRAALGQAALWGIVSRNVASLVEPPRASKHEIQPLTPDQARQLLDAGEGHRLKALFAVALALGLRLGEALGLRWADVDFDQNLLHVRQALQRFGGDQAARSQLRAGRKEILKMLRDARAGSSPEQVDALTGQLSEVRAALRRERTTLHFVEPKSQRIRRTVALPAIVAAALKTHRVQQLEERMRAGSTWQESGLVFTSTIGTPLDARNVSRDFHDILEEAKLPNIRFHDLRHTAASLLLAQGVSPRTIMETLGHSQISLTLDTYSHILPTMQREAADKMQEILMKGEERA